MSDSVNISPYLLLQRRSRDDVVVGLANRRAVSAAHGTPLPCDVEAAARLDVGMLYPDASDIPSERQMFRSRHWARWLMVLSATGWAAIILSALAIGALFEAWRMHG